jgi:hypothetical protein
VRVGANVVAADRGCCDVLIISKHLGRVAALPKASVIAFDGKSLKGGLRERREKLTEDDGLGLRYWLARCHRNEVEAALEVIGAH